MSTPFGVKILNSDVFFENLLTKHNLPHVIADPEKEKVTHKQQMDLRAYAKTLRDKKAVYFIDGMLPIIIDGTGKDYKKITKQANTLKAIGYGVSMLFINTSLDVALQRNEERARTVNPSLVEKMWKSVQQNLGKFQSYFGRSNFVLVDNSKHLETSQEKKKFANDMYKIGKNMIEKPLQNPTGKHVIKTLKKIGGKYYSDYLDCIGSIENCDELANGAKEGK